MNYWLPTYNIFNFPSLNWKLINRIALSSLAIMLVSACTQPEQEIALENTQNKSVSNESSLLGYQESFSYPDFSGEYKVATHSQILTDYRRLNQFVEASIEPRQIQVRFYYPSHSGTSDDQHERLPVISSEYWDYMVGHQQKNQRKLRFDNYHSSEWDIKLNTHVNTTNNSYPVLIFSHGYGYNPESYSALSAELASRGYIIVSINHTYGANPSKLSDNNLIWAKPLPKDDPGAYIETWSNDQSFVIDQLTLINNDLDSIFYQKLNLTNLGVFGHSYGGAAAYHTASNDPRVKALIDIDGTVFGYEDKYIVQPFAFILSKDHQPKFDYNNAGYFTYQVRFSDFQHASFTDHILWWQWDHGQIDLGFGKVNGLRAIEITTDIVDNFFSHFLFSDTLHWQYDGLSSEEVLIQNK